MAVRRSGAGRERGYVRRRGGSYQVLVYAGVDPVSGKDSYLNESTKIPEIRTRLLARVDRQRNAATRATLEHTLNAWFDVHEVEETTLAGYRWLADKHIIPALGDLPISKIGPRTLEQLSAQLRRCSARCNGKPYIEHRSSAPHDCRLVQHRRPPGRPSATSRAEHDCEAAGCKVIECQPHVCRPLSSSTVRQIHSVISGALAAAARWEWIPSNPGSGAKQPKKTPPQPKPPTPEDAARIAEAAWEQDADWGTFVWLKMVSGARRGELLALRWIDVHLDVGVLEVRRNFTRRGGKAREKATKTHQIRRVGLDPETVEVLREQRQRYEEHVASLGVASAEDAFVFSYETDHSRPCDPDGVSHRYKRMCRGLGIETHLHSLRHYVATELIAAGFDVRSVAGQLGHGGGGSTTLRVYAAWVAESDKRAAEVMAGKMRRPPKPARSEQRP